MIPGYLTPRSTAPHSESVPSAGTTGTGLQENQWADQLNEQCVTHTLSHLVRPFADSTTCPVNGFSGPHSPLSCGCVLAMIHLTRQHFIRVFREKRGFCHFPESFPLLGAGSTPLASPSRLPSATLPSACRGRRRTGAQDGLKQDEMFSLSSMFP